MTWDKMCAGPLTVGEQVDLSILYGQNANEALLRSARLPDKTTLSKYAEKAEHLKVDAPSAGIYFNIVHGIYKKNVLNTTELYKGLVDRKFGSRGCFEDEILPERYKKPEAGVDILVHQSLIPCERCRTGYKNWAKQNGCTIVLYGDGKYDTIGPNILFIFSVNGDVYYG